MVHLSNFPSWESRYWSFEESANYRFRETTTTANNHTWHTFFQQYAMVSTLEKKKISRKFSKEEILRRSLSFGPRIPGKLRTMCDVLRVERILSELKGISSFMSFIHSCPICLYYEPCPAKHNTIYFPWPRAFLGFLFRVFCFSRRPLLVIEAIKRFQREESYLSKARPNLLI